MATHSSILAWRIENPHGQRILAMYSPWGLLQQSQRRVQSTLQGV